MEVSLLRSPFFRPITRDLPLRITPGPFEVTPTVLEAAARAFAGHRSPVFRNLLGEIREMVVDAFEIDRRSKYTSVILTGTGTAAMEAMAAATVPERRPLALVNGRFSRRLADIALLYQPATRILDFGVGNPIDLGEVEAILRRRETDQLLFTVQDTREGILNSYPELCELGRRYAHLLCVDAISANVAEPLLAARRGIDLFTASSGKAIRGLPGLGILCGKKEVFDSLTSSACRSYYLNLCEHYRIQENRSEPWFAPATALYCALHQALLELLAEGVEARRATILRRTRRVREAVEGHGMDLLRPPAQMPSSVTSVLLPQGVRFAEFEAALQERGLLVYSGSSVIEDCFQIGTAGYLTDAILDEGLAVLQETIQLLMSRKEIPHVSTCS